jgi:hypothetical protein
MMLLRLLACSATNDADRWCDLLGEADSWFFPAGLWLQRQSWTYSNASAGQGEESSLALTWDVADSDRWSLSLQRPVGQTWSISFERTDRGLGLVDLNGDTANDGFTSPVLFPSMCGPKRMKVTRIGASDYTVRYRRAEDWGCVGGDCPPTVAPVQFDFETAPPAAAATVSGTIVAQFEGPPLEFRLDEFPGIWVLPPDWDEVD